MHQRRADQIATDLEEAILSGDYQDGDRLDEARLAAEFSVSRTPLREALQKLSLSGLIERLPNRGVFVRQPGPVELVELFELMAELEASCARLSAMRISDEALEEMRLANASCRKAVENNSPDEYSVSNMQFHAILYREAGNRALAKETKRLVQRLRPYRRSQLQVRGRLLQSLHEHESIISALSSGNAEQASNAMREHVVVQGDKFHYLMSNMKAK